ncbi:biotin-dependent carboxyltransferase family protein [Jannaschia sp. W003]|uniref:5-oxoprolinase subunit C family protein n=1 Tax=Jannaschia sp. W003 TaxID=2867012 RepID=UPI0021A7A8A6|nr:biotin-dependent carboxyltransferase family protein [Jannaschia sp. W003]UWQ20976.1 biotin-dependent carboxyltransferase family protein [Jannaschia sp. W003]
MIEVLHCGPLVTVQDGGRPGHLALGLARGGAADRRALAEARALLGRCGAGIESPGLPLTLRFGAPCAVALTGAPMRAKADGRALRWHASHMLAAGMVLRLRPLGAGYSYVTPAGGLDWPEVMGSQAAHPIAGIGRALRPGDRLGPGAEGPSRVLRRPEERFNGGTLRCVVTPQTALFPEAERARFEATAFRRDPRGNRQGVRLAMDGEGFRAEGQLSLLSDFILPGDVQMTGDGVPFVLGPESQTTGGYPRIAHVIAADLPRAMQAPPGAELRFRFVTLAEARAAAPGPPATEALVRDPRDVDLLAHQLVDGVVDARED